MSAAFVPAERRISSVTGAAEKYRISFMSHNLFRLQNVSFTYNSGKTVFHDINLDINKNDLLIIRGDSGAGKSTLLKLLNRFCDCTDGNILFNGRNLNEYKIDALRSSVIYFPQLPVIIDGTVKDNLSFPFAFRSHKNREYSQEKARKWLDYFQLDIPLDHNALELSIGQKQRIVLIRSMLLEPEVLLLDEPGSALDSNNKKLIEQKIESLIVSSGITVLMATHSEVSFSIPGVQYVNLEEGRLKSIN